MRCFPEPRRVGAVVCCPRRLSLCTMQLPEARFGPSVRRGLADERPSRLRVHGCGLGPEGLGAPNPASPPRRTRREWVSGIGDPQQICRAHGARSSPAPLCPLESGGPGAKKACVAFLRWAALGLDFCPRRISLCRMQLPEARFGPSVRRGLGAERPSLLRGHGCGLGPEGFRAPDPASRPRRTRRELVSGTGDPQQRSRSQGARSSPAPLCPLESGGPGPKTACVAFLSRGALGLLLAARGDFPCAECFQKRVVGRLCDGAAALSGRAGSGGMAAAWAQKAFARPILLPRQGEPVGSGFRAPETPSKQ